jgi:hypothetical protein
MVDWTNISNFIPMITTADLERVLETYDITQRETQSALTRRGMTRKAERGGLNGLAPVGYFNRRCGDETWVEIDLIKSPLVKEAFALLSQGRTLRAALREMTAKGLRSRHGKLLCVGAFYKLATNPFYAGIVEFEGVRRSGTHEALIPVEQFYPIQGRLQERRRKNPHSSPQSCSTGCREGYKNIGGIGSA